MWVAFVDMTLASQLKWMHWVVQNSDELDPGRPVGRKQGLTDRRVELTYSRH